MSDVKSVEINGQNIYEIWDDNGHPLWPNNTYGLTIKNITNPFYLMSRDISHDFSLFEDNYRAVVLCANTRLQGKFKNISGQATRRQFYYNYDYYVSPGYEYELQLPVYQGPDKGIGEIRRGNGGSLISSHIFGRHFSTNVGTINRGEGGAPSVFIMREFNEIPGVYMSPYFNDTVFISKYMTKTCLLKYTKDLNEALDFTPCLLDDPFTTQGTLVNISRYRYKDIIAGNITPIIFVGETYPLAYDPSAIVTGDLDSWVPFTTPQGPKYNTIWSMVQSKDETYPGLTADSRVITYNDQYNSVRINPDYYDINKTWYVYLDDHHGNTEQITDNSMTWEKYKQYIKQYIGQVYLGN